MTRRTSKSTDYFSWTCRSCQWINGVSVKPNDLSRKFCGNCRRKRDAPLENVSFIKTQPGAVHARKSNSKEITRFRGTQNTYQLDSDGSDWELGHPVSITVD